MCGVLALASAACAGNKIQEETAGEATTVASAATGAAGATTIAPPPPGEVPYYTVVQGDTIGKIATKLGVTAQLIVDANGLANANKISIGQKLRIPAGGKAADGSIVGGGPAGSATTAATVAAAGASTTVKK